MASIAPGLGFGAPSKAPIDFKIFQWKCTLQNENGLALSKMKFQTCGVRGFLNLLSFLCFPLAECYDLRQFRQGLIEGIQVTDDGPLRTLLGFLGAPLGQLDRLNLFRGKNKETLTNHFKTQRVCVILVR